MVYARPFASKAVFWAIWNEFELAVDCSLYKKDKGGNLVLKGFQHRGDFSPQNLIALLSNFAALRSKDSRFFSYLPIENPSELPGAGPRRKAKSHSIRATGMRSKIHMCQPETIPLIHTCQRIWLNNDLSVIQSERGNHNNNNNYNNYNTKVNKKPWKVKKMNWSIKDGLKTEEEWIAINIVHVLAWASHCFFWTSPWVISLYY